MMPAPLPAGVDPGRLRLLVALPATAGRSAPPPQP